MALRKLLLILFLFAFIKSESQTPMHWLRGKRPTLIYLKDSFTGTDSTLLAAHTMDIGSGWTAQQMGLCAGYYDYRIISNQTDPDPGILSNITADAGVSDYVAAVDCIVPNSNDYLGGLLVRFDLCSDYWAVFIERDAGGTAYLAILESNGGTRTYRATINFTTPPTNTTVRITATLNGTSIVATASTGETCSYTSSFLQTKTLVGMVSYDDGATYTPSFKYDNFLVYKQ